MKKSSIATALLLFASAVVHAEQIKNEAVAVSSTAKCQIVVGPKNATTTSESDYRYSSLPFCDLERPNEEITDGLFIKKIANDGSVIL